MTEVIVWFLCVGALALTFGMPKGARLEWRFPMTWHRKMAAAGSVVAVGWLYAQMNITGHAAGFLASLAGLVPFVRISAPAEGEDQHSQSRSLRRLPPPDGRPEGH